MNVLEQLRDRFAAATPEGGDPATFAQAVRASADPKFGDYQANGCMAIAKARQENPRALADRVASAVDLAPMAGPPEVAGPGFLNVRVASDFISSTLGTLVDDPRLGVVDPAKIRTVVIDYSSPNVAKPMHVGHLRSTVIGEALARILVALGHKVIRDNHLGDWGSQFGMILWGWKNHRDDAAYAANPVGELARLYRLAQSKIKPGDDARKRYGKAIELDEQGKAAEARALFAKLSEGTDHTFEIVARQIAEGRDVNDATRSETAKLHAGDFENRVLWDQFMPHCMAAIQAMYDRLDIKHDVHLGESFYDPMLKDVVADLEARGLAVPSEGALVIHNDGFNSPLMIRKRDGAYNYGTTDMAKVKYCRDEFNADLLLYVVDHRQSDHFEQVFATARKWDYADIQFEHVAFGTILGPNKRPYKTRDGDVVGLESLLDEAVAAARRVVDQTSGHLPENRRAAIAEVVGLGAIKYADLAQNRLSDYVFDMEKMVALTGNTGAYLQYAYARIQSIFRKSETTPEAIRQSRPPIALSNPAERALGMRVLRFPEILEFAASELKPNILTDYLFDLANTYSTFYIECPVLKAESTERRESRLALIDLTARTIRSGLDLLGIGVVDEM